MGELAEEGLLLIAWKYRSINAHVPPSTVDRIGAYLHSNDSTGSCRSCRERSACHLADIRMKKNRGTECVRSAASFLETAFQADFAYQNGAAGDSPALPSTLYKMPQA